MGALCFRQHFSALALASAAISASRADIVARISAGRDRIRCAAGSVSSGFRTSVRRLRAGGCFDFRSSSTLVGVTSVK